MSTTAGSNSACRYRSGFRACLSSGTEVFSKSETRNDPAARLFSMTSNQAKDLTQEPPRSPRERLGGFVIFARTVDKCRADLAGTIGEYHFDCPLDNMLF